MQAPTEEPHVHESTKTQEKHRFLRHSPEPEGLFPALRNRLHHAQNDTRKKSHQRLPKSMLHR